MATFKIDKFFDYLNIIKENYSNIVTLYETINQGKKQEEIIAWETKTKTHLPVYFQVNKWDIINEIRENFVSLIEPKQKKEYFSFLSKFCTDLEKETSEQIEVIKSERKLLDSYFSYAVSTLYEQLENFEESLNYLNDWINTEFEKEIVANEVLRNLFGEDYPQNTNNLRPQIKQKIKWRGELKEFAELIYELEKNKWIELPHGELKPIVESLCSCFDFSATKNKENSNTANSLMQYLKPSEREEKIFTKRYTRKFPSIVINIAEK